MAPALGALVHRGLQAVHDRSECGKLDTACQEAAERAQQGGPSYHDDTGSISMLLLIVLIGYTVFFVAFAMMACSRRRGRGSDALGTTQFVPAEVVMSDQLPATEHDKYISDLEEVWKKAFIRKVYAILSIQIMVTVLVSIGMMLGGGMDLMRWLATGSGMAFYNFCLIGTFVFLIGTICCFKDKHPHNLIGLGLFTLCESALIGVICTAYMVSGMGLLVLEAFALTSIIFIGLTLYTMQSKRNFDFLGPFLMVGLLAMMFWFLFMMLFPVALNSQLIALVGVLFFCGFVVYDTHMIMNRLTYDQHILGAINLYLDFLNLFLCILRLLSGGRE